VPKLSAYRYCTRFQTQAIFWLRC